MPMIKRAGSRSRRRLRKDQGSCTTDGINKPDNRQKLEVT
jgi:hypothetical protein